MDIPSDVIKAANLVGRWTAENNIESWEIGPCASRSEITRLREKLKIAEDALDSAGRYICLAVPFSDGVTRQISEALAAIRSE
jgi:hypothetical protein